MKVHKFFAYMAKGCLVVAALGSFAIAGMSLYTTLTGNAIGAGGDKPVLFLLSSLALGILASYMFFRVREK